jgi:hypothetical protein
VLSPLHFWLVFVATGGLLVVLAWLGSRRRRLNPREIAESTSEVGCGHCGYDARGLPSDICPECGSDLSEVGRIAPQFRRWQRVPPLLRGLVFAVVVLLLAAILGGLGLGDHVPYRQRMSGTEDLRLKTLTATDGSLLLLPSTVVRDEWHPSDAQIRTSNPSRLSLTPVERRILVEAIPGNPASGTPTGPAIARLEIDAISGQWSVTQGTQTLRQGTNPISPEDVLFFLSLAVYEDAPPDLQSIIDRADGSLDTDRVERDRARRVLRAAGALYCNTKDTGRVWLDMDPLGGGRHWADQLPESWRRSIPPDGFLFSYQGGGTGSSCT